MKKIMFFLLAVLLVLLSLVSCAGGENGNETETPSGTALTAQTETNSGTNPETDGFNDDPDRLFLVRPDGSTEFTLIRPEKTVSVVVESMQKLARALSERSGDGLPLSDDWERGYSVENPLENDACEILIGNTNRAETQKIRAGLQPGEYQISVEGNKLVLVGYTEYLTSFAVSDFIKHVLSNTEGEGISLPRDFSRKGIRENGILGDTDATVRVMTFNILGSASDDPPRASAILQTVETYQPSVLCFQECNATRYTNVLAKLTDYAIAAAYHPGTKTRVYTPILYRVSQFELIGAGVEWLDSRYQGTNTKSLAWAILKDRTAGDLFAVVNLHGAIWMADYPIPEGSSYEGMRELANVWRTDNVRQMNDCTLRLQKEYGKIPVLWTGDFNFNSASEAYRAAVDTYGMKDAEITATDSRVTGMKSYHGTVGAAPGKGLTIDHIFGTPDVTFRVHYICMEQNDLNASDHCPVWADVRFDG